MGGGGGSFPSYINPDEFQKELTSSIDETKKKEYETKVAALLDGFLTQANARDIAKVGKRMEDLKKCIEKEIDEGTLILNFGGSVKKHTYVDGLSDIDALVIISNTELADKNPPEVKRFFENKIKGFHKDFESIEHGTLSVKVSFKDGMEIQLLPALKTETGIKIPSSNGKEWSKIINPQKFASKLTKINSNLNGKVVPAIKIIKIINSQLPDKWQMTGYHIESLAIEAFKTYKKKDATTKLLVAHFFESATSLVKTTIKDSTGQSLHVDDYLGKKNSEMRKGISYQLDFVHRKIKKAEQSMSSALWEDVLGEL